MTQNLQQAQSANDHNIPSSTNHNFTSQMNKTYDDCSPTLGLISFLVKLIPMLIYLLVKLLTDAFLGLFVCIVLLVAVDFWTTKNILGPKLVGLVWFTIVDDQQKEKWCFSACPRTRIISKVNMLFFWLPQLVGILFWIVIFIINLVTLGIFWVGLAIYTCTLFVINFGLFVQCKGDHQKTVTKIGKRFGFDIYHQQQNVENVGPNIYQTHSIE